METKKQNAPDDVDVLEGQPCPLCGATKLTLMEKEMEIPYFDRVLLFSMNCSACNYQI